MPTASRVDDRFRLTESQARDLAARFGTPLYVVDEAHFRGRIRRYREAFAAAYPDSEISFASKANSTLALLRIAFDEGCTIDVASEGELRAALAAGVPAAECHLHGNNKSEDELRFAIEAGVGQIVADSFEELALLERLYAELGTGVPIVLRLAPGVNPETHAKISTGQEDTKFGFNVNDGSAARAVDVALASGFRLVGFHCHVGSQLLNPEAQRAGGEAIARFAAETFRRTGYRAELLNVGGGLGVRYTDADVPMEPEPYNRLVVEAILEGLEGTGIRPRLAQEPGRALVAESGLTLYRVGNLKTVPRSTGGTRTFVAVDGGLSDNPRPALYGSRYTVERVARGTSDWTYATDGPGAVVSGEPAGRPFTVSGKHCETDKLFEDVELPGDLAEGDLLQVLCTGAYNASMASNYNRYPRPATALIRADGTPVLIQRRDTWDEMLAREILP